MRSLMASARRAVVDDMQFQCQSVALAPQGDLARTRVRSVICASPAACVRQRLAAFWAMFSSAWMSCARSPRTRGWRVS